MLKPLHLSVDAMGGDLGPRLCVPASLIFLNQHPNVSLTLVGDKAQISSFLPSHTISRLSIQHAETSVSMAEKPSAVLRHGQTSSLWKAIEFVAKGEADGCVSGGNTGALMAVSRHLLGVQEGVIRPAICKAMPSAKGACFLLDLGANVECSVDQLVQFAHLGAAIAKTAGVEEPRVGLLNIGVEALKGREDIQSAAEKIEADESLRFTGYAEPDQIYSGDYDVIVCDGFSGNVALKASEGVARYILAGLRRWSQQTIWRRILLLALAPLIRNAYRDIDPDHYNGAAFVGLNGVVVKSHGAASELGYVSALNVALQQAKFARQCMDAL